MISLSNQILFSLFNHYTVSTERPDGETTLTARAELFKFDDVGPRCLLETLEVRPFYVMREMQIDMYPGLFRG